MIRKRHINRAHCINTVFLLAVLGCKVATYCIDTKLSESREGEERLSSMNMMFTVLTLAELLYVMITVVMVGISGVIVARALRKSPVILTHAQQAR